MTLGCLLRLSGHAGAFRAGRRRAPFSDMAVLIEGSFIWSSTRYGRGGHPAGAAAIACRHCRCWRVALPYRSIAGLARSRLHPLSCNLRLGAVQAVYTRCPLRSTAVRTLTCPPMPCDGFSRSCSSKTTRTTQMAVCRSEKSLIPSRPMATDRANGGALQILSVYLDMSRNFLQRPQTGHYHQWPSPASQSADPCRI